MRLSHFAILALGVGALSACTTTPKAGPVEVTRFHQAETLAQLGQTTIFIDNAPGEDISSLELAPYKQAISQQLATLGYREVPRAEAKHIAVVSLERFVSEPQPKRSPVSVGVGGGTGGRGSGVGMGIGINLGGNKSTQEVGSQLALSIRDAASNNALWEGRANFAVSVDSPLADSEANAAAMADALFREFPGNNGETVEVKVAQ